MNCPSCHNTLSLSDRYCKVCGENNAHYVSETSKIKKAKETFVPANHGREAYQPTHPTEKAQETEKDPYYEQERLKIETKHRAYLKELYNQRDYAAVSTVIIAFLLPIIGVIMSLTWRNTYPHKSAQVLNSAIIGFIVNAVILILFM